MAHRVRAAPDIGQYVQLLCWLCLLVGVALLLGIGLRWWLQDTPEKALGRYLMASETGDVDAVRRCFSDGYLRVFDSRQGLWVRCPQEHYQEEFEQERGEWLRIRPRSLRLGELWRAVVWATFGDGNYKVHCRLHLDEYTAKLRPRNVGLEVGKAGVQGERAVVPVTISVLPEREERQPLLGRRPVRTQAFLRFHLAREGGRWLIVGQEYCGLEWGRWLRLGLLALALWNALFACLYSAVLIGVSYPLWTGRGPAAAWYVRLPGGGRGAFVRKATEKESMAAFGRERPDICIILAIILANVALACYCTFRAHEIYFPTLPTWFD